MATFPDRKRILGIGEVMVEISPAGSDRYRKGFAGDTFNTCWHIAQILGDRAYVRYLTRVGSDRVSEEAVDFLVQSGIDCSCVVRDPRLTIGLYLVHLDNTERSFSYWRENAAARQLAADPVELAEKCEGAGLIHFSGITLAVIGDLGRKNLLRALAHARVGGAMISFDPNIRPKLWPGEAEMRHALEAAMSVCDIALPTFDDESLCWGDADPAVTLQRFGVAGAREIVVKNGARDAHYIIDGVPGAAPSATGLSVCDTTGAGDGFNAGYLSARIMGLDGHTSCQLAHSVAGEVICHMGALASPASIDRIRSYPALRKAPNYASGASL